MHRSTHAIIFVLAAAIGAQALAETPKKPAPKSETAVRESIDIDMPKPVELTTPIIKAPDIKAPKIVMPKDMPPPAIPDGDTAFVNVQVKGLSEGISEAEFLAAAKTAFAKRDENGDGMLSKRDMPKPSAPPAAVKPPAMPDMEPPKAFAPPKVVVPKPPEAPPAPNVAPAPNSPAKE